MNNKYFKLISFLLFSCSFCLIAQESNKTNLSDSVSNSSKVLTLVKSDSLKNISNTQTNENTTIITVCSSGSSIDEATTKALRNALEQVFGVFISSKTEILNDKLYSDKIATISSGNIISYEILNKERFSDGKWSITMSVVVSIDNLTKYCESKGVTIEFKGTLFTRKIEQQILNEEAEYNAILNMIGFLHERIQLAFDYTIKNEEPNSLDSESKLWNIPLHVNVFANENMDICSNYMKNTLKYLALNEKEVEFYKNTNKKTFKISINNSDFFIRNENSFKVISSFVDCWLFYTSGFVVENGFDKSQIVAIYRGEDDTKINATGTLYFDEQNKNKIEYIPIEINKLEFYDGFHRNENINISFPAKGDLLGNYKWKEIKTLQQIENITNYTVKPAINKSNFKEGGYVVYEKNGHGLVIATKDMGELGYDDAIDTSKKISINGYNDWRLPSEAESKLVLQFLHPENKNLERRSAYWALKNNYGYREMLFIIGKCDESRSDDTHYTRYVRVF